jgi:hypothetical protein
MTYRDNADAIAARHATLTAELAQKQRELDEVTAMLADVRRADQAESYFERAPDLRRRQKHHLAAAGLILALFCGGALGAEVSAAKHSHRVQAVEQEARLVRIRSTQATRESAQRLRAEIEALRALGGPLAEARLGQAAPVRAASAAAEHER